MSHKYSIPKRKNHRVGVFIDVANMYHSAKNLYGARVNFNELLKVVTAGRELVRAVAYVVKSDTEEEKAFFEALEKSGFELKIKDLQVFPGGMKKGDWDVGLAIDAISLSKQLDVVIIISGDGDLEPLVNYLKFSGLIVEAAGFRRSTSSKLIDVSHNFMDLDEIQDKVIMRSRNRQMDDRIRKNKNNNNKNS
jgi:uncharacterized LabA/DUF88 family protein